MKILVTAKVKRNHPVATTSEGLRSKDATEMAKVKDCERKARRKAEMTSEELEEERKRRRGT